MESDAAQFSFALDEHVLTNAKRDEDFDGGGAVTVSGRPASTAGFFFQDALRGLDRLDGIEDRRGTPESRAGHAFAAGLLIFTPGNLAATQPVRGDRPYASLFFLSGGRRYVAADEAVVYDSTLTIGILGLSAAESVQRALHRLTDSTPPAGWRHQVSAGGEPTARYTLARQALLRVSSRRRWGSVDAKWTLQGSLGTVTEGDIAIEARWGRLESPWWAFSPAENTYVADTQPAPAALAPRSAPEIFLMLGARMKVRAYDAFLQGQFRHSDYRLRYGALNPVLGEAWAGFDLRWPSGFDLEYLVRWESPELRRGVGSRSIVWGSIALTKSFSP